MTKKKIQTPTDSQDGSESEQEPVTPAFRRACDVVSQQVGVPPNQWGRLGKLLSPIVKADGDRAIEGVTEFIRWYRSSTWRQAERPLTVLVFYQEFEAWYAAWRINQVVVLPSDNFASEVIAPGFQNMALPFTPEWLERYFSYHVAVAFTWNIEASPYRFAALRKAVGTKLEPMSFADRAQAAHFVAGFVAITLNNHNWIVKAENYDALLNNFDAIVAEYRRYNSRVFQPV